MVAETVQQIYNQGQEEIQRLRDEANGLKSEQETKSESVAETKPKKTRKAKKTVTKSE